MPTASINGLKHYYEDHGSGEALVMLHGAQGSAHQFEEHFPELSKRLRVIVPDMRGMGRSEHVKELPPSAWEDDLMGLLDELGISQANVYGSSLGARVAMRFAIDHPERVRSLILNNPIIFITPEATANLNRAGGDASSLAPAQQADLLRRHGADWADVVRNYFNIRNVPELQEYHNLDKLVSQIKCPVLVIRHDSLEDTTHPFAHAVDLRTRLPQSHLAFVPSYATGGTRFDGAKLRQLILEFADSLAPAPAGTR